MHVDFRNASMQKEEKNFIGPQLSSYTAEQSEAIEFWKGQATSANDYLGYCWEVFATPAQKMSGGNGVLNINKDIDTYTYLQRAADILGNEFTDANIIAGILGNFWQESKGNPFALSQSGYYGLYQTNDSNFIQIMSNNGLLKYFNGTDTPKDEHKKKCVDLTMNYLMSNWNGSSNYPSQAKNGKLVSTENMTEAAAQAELFAVMIERCVGGSDSVLCAKV